MEKLKATGTEEAGRKTPLSATAETGPGNDPRIDDLVKKVEVLSAAAATATATEAKAGPEHNGEDRRLADVQLEVLTKSHRGESLADEKLRGSLRDLRIQLANDSTTPPAKIVEAANGLVEAHFALANENGSDSDAALPVLRPGAPVGAQHFDMGRYFSGMVVHAKAIGKPIRGAEDLGGSVEAEYLSGVLNTPDRKAMFAKHVGQALSDAPPGSSAIPIPQVALGIGPAGRQYLREMRLAQTYGTGERLAQTYGSGEIPQYRERDYRGDLRVDYDRPLLALDRLGVDQRMINNDVTIAEVTGVPAASFVAENAQAPDQSVTVSSRKTTAHRMAVKVDTSWMLQQAGDQIGIDSLVNMEIGRAIDQLRERTAFGKAVTDGPTGLGAISGVNDPGLTAALTTLTHIQTMFQSLQEDNIDTAGGKFLLSVADRTALASALTFAASGGTVSRRLFEPMGSDMAGMGAAYDGMVEGYPACISNNVPSDLGTGNDETMVAFGQWMYHMVFDYGMGILTIDNLSQAGAAQTRSTYNAWMDVLNRHPVAFSVFSHT